MKVDSKTLKDFKAVAKALAAGAEAEWSHLGNQGCSADAWGEDPFFDKIVVSALDEETGGETASVVFENVAHSHVEEFFAEWSSDEVFGAANAPFAGPSDHSERMHERKQMGLSAF